MNLLKFERVGEGVSQNGQPRRLLVKHFCETNVGCSFLSGQYRFAYLESNGRQFCPPCNAVKNDRVQNHYPALGLWSEPNFRLCEVCEVLRSPYVVKRDTG